MPNANSRSQIGALFCALLSLLFAAAPLVFSTDTDATSLWTRFVGGFHPLILHLPIGIVFLAIVLQLLALWLPAVDRNILSVIWLLSALTASLSFATGFMLGSEGGFERDLIVPHLWAAGIFTSLCWVCLALSLLQTRLALSIPLQAACILSMMTAGHYGGLMVHGNPLAAAPWKPENQPLVFLPEIGDEVNAYHDIVQPILRAKCVSCHGPAKQSGGLRLDSIEFAWRGSDKGTVLVANDADRSELMKSLLYPISSDKHMPPKNKPQLNAFELAVIEWWIESGANDQLNFARSKAPEVVSPFLATNYRLLPDPEAERRKKEKEAEIKREQQLRRSELAARLDQLPPALRQHFLFTSQESDELVFRCLTSPLEFDDESLQQVAQLLFECSEVDLSSTAITNGALASFSFGPQLRVLKLNHLSLTANALACLEEATSLRSLSLFGSSLSDDAAERLSQHSSLNSLFLGQTNLSPAAINSIRNALPSCKVVGDMSLTEFASDEQKAAEKLALQGAAAAPAGPTSQRADPPPPPEQPLPQQAQRKTE